MCVHACAHLHMRWFACRCLFVWLCLVRDRIFFGPPSRWLPCICWNYIPFRSIYNAFRRESSLVDLFKLPRIPTMRSSPHYKRLTKTKVTTTPTRSLGTPATNFAWMVHSWWRTQWRIWTMNSSLCITSPLYPQTAVHLQNSSNRGSSSMCWTQMKCRHQSLSAKTQ